MQAAGKYKETKIGSFIEAGLNIGISISAVIKFGLIGVTVGTIVANLFRTVQYAMYVSIKLIHRSILEVVKRVIWAIAIVGIVLKFYSFFMQLIFYRSWLEWCLSGVLCFIISTFVTVLMAIVFYKRDLSAVFMIIKRMMFKEDTGNKEK